ncbi:unnamed protein product [Brassica rapa]|uniref:Reverse transcriptase domain-containing protein n=1 Tax=Brassica campestris TaxID=3711 RepID=A0A8D9GTF7_BRACM|nr:unnamed protein product [Brassica rapa]
MKCFSWNIRGLNGGVRKSNVQRWIHQNRPMIGGLLETHVKQESLDNLMSTTFPGWRFDSNHSEEAENGRIVVMWNPRISVVVYLKSEQLMVCGVFDPASRISFTVGFVYAYNERSQRIALWSSLVQLSLSSSIRNSPWLVLGVFNQVLSTDEAYSLYPVDLCIGGMGDFQDCIDDSGVFDLSFRGCPFTWTNKSPSNPKSRKLDRALVNEAWMEVFPNSNALFDAPGSSDHSPCLITVSDSAEHRKSRFTFFSFFETHPEYLKRLSEAWTSPVSRAGPMSTLYLKLRAAKNCCKAINQSRFSNIEKRTREAFEKLQDIQEQVLHSPSPLLFSAEAAARDEWLILAAAEQNFFQLKSRVRWLCKGDLNTRFFHKSVKANLSRNIIHFLTDGNNTRVYGVQEMKDLAVRFYSFLQGRSNIAVTPYAGSAIALIHPYRCSESLSACLAELPSTEGITSIVFALPKGKAPGPDGFSAEFFTSSWNLVGLDVTNAVKHFFTTKMMSRQTNATVISLIPKISGASSLSDFRPVSLCNTVYKVISKVLAHRLKRITKDAVQQNQVGFVSGRVLSDNVLLASELVADFHKPGRISRGCLQVDITKAYDSVEWEFIMNILSAFQLPPLFMDWIWACISTPYYSVSLNGELAGFFPGEKGLRQGDPISSSLFVLAMDVLSKELDLAAREGRFGIHPKCAFPLVTHLSFADDLLIFFDGTADSLRGIMQVLRDFQRKSGLALNLRKTSVFLDGNDRVAAQSVATDFGLTQGSLPVKYLGLPLSSRRLGRIGYQPLLDKVRQRISSWTARHLSFSGKAPIASSVIYSIINFWAAVFPLPQGCLEELERMCNAFLWSGAPNSAKGAKVSWDSVCTPKESGGLGLKRLVGLNELYGVKLIWKLFEAVIRCGWPG